MELQNDENKQKYLAYYQKLQHTEHLLLNKPSGDSASGLLFLSAQYDALPTAICLDPLLKPIDKIVFYNIWLFGKQNGQNITFPDYAFLCKSCNSSRATIANSIKKLRVYGALVIARRIRDDMGRYRGNIYIINPEPMLLGNIIEFDADYMSFLQHTAQESASKHLQLMAQARLQTINDDIINGNDPLEVSVKHAASRRIEASYYTTKNDHKTTNSGYFNFNSNAIHRVQNLNLAQIKTSKQLESSNNRKNLQEYDLETVPSLNFEPSSKTKLGFAARSSSSSSSSSKLLYHTTTTNSSAKLNTVEKNFKHQKFELGAGIIEHKKSLQAFLYSLIESDLQVPVLIKHLGPKTAHEYAQFLLDELNEAVSSKLNSQDPVRNPINYLMGIIKKIVQLEYASNGGYEKAHALRVQKKRREQDMQAQFVKAESKITVEVGELYKSRTTQGVYEVELKNGQLFIDTQDFPQQQDAAGLDERAIKWLIFTHDFIRY